MSLRERLHRLENRFYAAIRHPSADEVASAPLGPAGLDALHGAAHCLVVSYRRNGQPIATPVWFAIDGDRLVFESDADSLKLKRIGRNPHVRVAPCTSRGRPLAPPAEATARILDPDQEPEAERALAEKYGWSRRLTSRLRPTSPAGLAYVEVTPGPSSHRHRAHG